ncbi:hypothetical protein L7F22_054095 [Adiantum nelumboides]|nr:hypothetical protein [Adiantum nelumboides]
MTQTAMHKAKAKDLEQELVKAKVDLEIQKQKNEALNKGKEEMGSLTHTMQISETKTHLHVQLPHMPDMPNLLGTSQHDEEQQGPAPGNLDVKVATFSFHFSRARTFSQPAATPTLFLNRLLSLHLFPLFRGVNSVGREKLPHRRAQRQAWSL